LLTALVWPAWTLLHSHHLVFWGKPSTQSEWGSWRTVKLTTVVFKPWLNSAWAPAILAR
jgi:hypothetical protein